MFSTLKNQIKKIILSNLISLTIIFQLMLSIRNVEGEKAKRGLGWQTCGWGGERRPGVPLAEVHLAVQPWIVVGLKAASWTVPYRNPSSR